MNKHHKLTHTLPPPVEMVRLLLDYGARVDTAYKTNQEDPDKFDWDEIDIVEKEMVKPENEPYQKEYAKIISLLYQGLALEVILATPLSMSFKEEEYAKRASMLANLAKYHPEAFQTYPNPPQDFDVKEINPNETVFDIIYQEDVKIGDFLEEDRENHIVMIDYNHPDSVFFIDLTKFRKAIDVDPDETGGGGGNAVKYQCNKASEGLYVAMGNVKNLTPYFDLKMVAGTWGGLVPLLELYDKLLNKPASVRGQYFSFKVLDEEVNPLAGIQVVNYFDRHINRYDRDLNFVSDAHCQVGQYGKVATIIQAVEKPVDTTKKGGTMRKTKKRRTLNKKKMMKTAKRRKTLRNRRRR